MPSTTIWITGRDQRPISELIEEARERERRIPVWESDFDEYIQTDYYDQVFGGEDSQRTPPGKNKEIEEEFFNRV